MIMFIVCLLSICIFKGFVVLYIGNCFSWRL